MKTSTTYFTALLMAAVLVLSGCTSPPADQQKTSDTNQQKVDGTNTPSDDGVTVTTKASGGLDLKTELGNLLKGKAKEYYVKYDTTLSSPGQGEYKSKMATYVRGTDTMRMDTIPVTDIEGMGESRYYMSPGKIVMCNKMGGDWSCSKIEQDEQQQKDPQQTEKNIEKNLDTSTVTKLPNRVIAGVTARCYKVVLNINIEEAQNAGLGQWEGTTCISPEGVLLYSDVSTEQMHMTQEATEYRTSVSDADFVPPAEPTDMMAYMNELANQAQQSPEDLPSEE